jgi:hypothetical protein
VEGGYLLVAGVSVGVLARAAEEFYAAGGEVELDPVYGAVRKGKRDE